MAMKIRTMGYLAGEAMVSLRRNAWLAAASAGTVAIALLILGAALLVVLNTNSVATHLESQVEISVIVKKDLPREQVEELGTRLRNLAGVKEVDFVSKEQALEKIKENFSDRRGVLEAIKGQNPLPDVYRVKMQKPEQVKPAAQEIETMFGVDKVKYGQGVVEKLFAITNWVRVAGSVLIGLLSLASVFLIYTTIRLTVFARRKEINIMKYLGATNWFIKLPFVLEGLVIGLIGAGVAVGILYFSYTSLLETVTVSLPTLPLTRDWRQLALVFEGLLGAGVLLGVSGSFIAVRRYLHV
ncbi:cell division transport system permease protein [Carboxydocella sporoproducens DSM 16521]|uniref:Cell division protein FtsX n=3 Tax=Clostridiales Family XVI. Incertae Sedis TaxID=543347 RepID=A0A1T4PZP1_9FIRM|nr:cell division protein FtsX [Carboxydocella thermautotrophica]AVX31685.1 cell division protein FtsX [Carboxydocella thermautotrophica]SJZ96741.1 cell division transport system permease protein [Carboxydocella sporoproducens DSM 16521]